MLPRCEILKHNRIKRRHPDREFTSAALNPVGTAIYVGLKPVYETFIRVLLNGYSDRQKKGEQTNQSESKNKISDPEA